MKIWFNIPWSQDKNIGKAYNDFMASLPVDDYACFIDGDAMFLDPYFGKHLYEILAANPDCEVLTCKTNRIGCLWQREPGMWNGNDISVHREVAYNIQSSYTTEVQDVTAWGTDRPMGGVLILISKRAWFKVGGFADGILGVDNKLHWSCIANDVKVWLMKGVYIYHYYRNGNAKDRSHLQ